MKKYITFLISFSLLYIILDLTSGLILTMNHQTNFTVNTALASTENFGQASLVPFLISLLSAILAYIFSQALEKRVS
ncbi:hypothetical protein [Halobacillus andaensis]|uniref:hypothetical protein n=1 Tax=Halobacillus andaensis TaxID=1176239 RepID=UPI001664F325|nr:hypothetical protein [Halobacillus andaensis]MBP2004667.1 hypothetical protein [Halobacillus andaensis]